MKFQVGIGLHGFKVTCRPGQDINFEVGTGGVKSVEVTPLVAKFEWENGFLFDSEKAQKKYNWTDEEQEFVENYLLDPDRNRYLNRSDLRKTMYCLDLAEEYNASLKAQSELHPAPEEKPKVKCRGWDVDANARCDEDAIEGIDYCKRHVPIREGV